MKSIAAKLGAGVLTFAMVFSLAGPASAQGLSSTQIDAILDLLRSFGADQGTINNVNAALNGQPTNGGGSDSSSSVCPYVWTRDLSAGSTGDDVMKLQQFLNDNGFTVAASGAGSPGSETMTFGPATAAAVTDMQNAFASEVLAPIGLSAGTGYFGALSRAKANDLCSTPSNGGGDDEGDDNNNGGGSAGLEGGAGSLADVDLSSGINNEEVGEDEADVEVYGLDVEADGSDIELRALGLDFSQGSGASDDFDEYAEEVRILLDGRVLATVDADRFEDDDNFDRTISLDRGGIIREDDEAQITIEVTGRDNLDSDQTGDEWTIAIDSIRFVDAQGAVISDTATGDIGTSETFSFETFASAADVELNASRSGDSPDSMVVNVDDSSDTDNVELLVFELEAEGSDIELKDLPITLISSGAGIATIANTVRVTIDGEEFEETLNASNAGMTGSTSITFDDFEYTISEGDEVEVVIEVDVNDLGGDFTDGDTLLASFTASNLNATDVEDESGEDLANADRSGTASGSAMAFYDEGIDVVFVDSSVSKTAEDNANNDSGEFEITFRVSAFDGTVYVASTTQATVVNDPSATGTGHTYRVTAGGTATVDALNAASIDGNYTTNQLSNKDLTDVGNIQIDEGESTEITIRVARTNDATNSDGAAFYEMFLEAVAWSSTDVSAGYNLYDFDLDDYNTASINLN